MINAISKVDELNKIIRNELILQSELSPKRVLNSIVKYGQNLTKQIQEQIFNSLEEDDTILLFQLQSRNSPSDVSFTNKLNDIEYIKSYNIKITLYGDNSSDVANKLVARFRTEICRNNLYDKGIYLENIDNPIKIDEFMNETLWPRSDVNIAISCRFVISQVIEENSFENISNIEIKNI